MTVAPVPDRQANLWASFSAERANVVSPRILQFLECEAMYLPRNEAVSAFLNTTNSDTETSRLTQLHYPNELASEIGRCVAGDLGLREEIEGLRFTHARLRKDEGEETTYHLQAKMRVPGIIDKLIKIELTMEIERGVYEREIVWADAGKIEKERTTVPGFILEADKPRSLVTAQIDRVMACGIGRSYHRVAPRDRFYTVDVEVSDPELIHRLRAGQHTFTFLHGAPELSAGDPAIDAVCKPIKGSYLAVNGFDDRSRQALARAWATHAE